MTKLMLCAIEIHYWNRSNSCFFTVSRDYAELIRSNKPFYILYIFVLARKYINSNSVISDAFERLDDKFDILQAKVRSKLLVQGFPEDRIHTECFLHLRYEGTDCALMCTPSFPRDSNVQCMRHGDFANPFLER